MMAGAGAAMAGAGDAVQEGLHAVGDVAATAVTTAATPLLAVTGSILNKAEIFINFMQVHIHTYTHTIII